MSALVVVLAHALTASFLPDFWALELASHYRPQELALAWLLASFLAVRRFGRRGAGVAFAVLAVGAGAGVRSRTVAGPATPLLQVVSFNVYTGNPNKDGVVRWAEGVLSKDGAHLVYFMETDAAWVEALRALKTRLPYAIEVPRPDNFGLMMLSDVPLAGLNVVYFDPPGIPALAGTVQVAGRPLRLAAVHPLPPVGERGYAARNRYLGRLRSWMEGSDGPALVIGDLNTSPWSPSFRRFKPSDWRDALPGTFKPHTWRAFGGALSTPIDYGLYSTSLTVTSAGMGPDLGSDHLPVVASFAW